MRPKKFMFGALVGIGAALVLGLVLLTIANAWFLVGSYLSAHG